MKRYYLKAMGSTCYDPETGITFPQVREFDLRGYMRSIGARNIRTAYQFGWNNQPSVLTFVLPSSGTFAHTGGTPTELYNLGLLIVEHWRNT